MGQTTLLLPSSHLVTPQTRVLCHYDKGKWLREHSRIRTHDGPSQAHNGFRDRHICPLCHMPKYSSIPKIRGKGWIQTNDLPRLINLVWVFLFCQGRAAQLLYSAVLADNAQQAKPKHV